MEDSSACISQTLSQPIPYANQEDHWYRALTSSYSFGRYESDLDLVKWSCFSRNRCMEEVQKLSKPGTVAAMKAYFEARYKRFSYNKKSAAVLPNQQNEGKVVEDGGKDDMFVDCPDELVSYDGTHGRVNVADNSKETIGTNLNKSDNGKDGGELEPLRAMLGESVADELVDASPEDGGKNDMFFDCPDELVSYDGTHGRVNVADNSEETIGTNLNKSDNGKDGGELEPLRAMLGKSVAEKESFALEHEAERIFFLQGLANLHYQLNALSSQGSLVDENDGGFINNYDSGMWEGEKSVVTDGRLQDIIYDCSKFVKHVLDERSQTQSTISELYSILNKKDQEIHELSARINESSVQQDTEAIVEKEHQISLEKDRLVKMLQEASGVALNEEEMQADLDSIIDQCLQKLKSQAKFSVESSQVESDITRRIQSLLYIRDFEAMLFQTLLEEEMLNRSEVNQLEYKISAISEELRNLKDEKDSLMNDLSCSEEKATLLRDKLSMAVKKGKGMVQEQENMKQLLDEKNASVQHLTLELEQLELTLNDYKNANHKLSTYADCVPRLEMDLNAVKEQRDQLEQFLAEGNRMFQRLTESIEGIIFPEGSAVKEPAEKVQRLAGYISECQAAKAQAQRELEIVKEEFITKYDELALAENKISMLIDEKEDVEVSRDATLTELHKVREEASRRISELSEAHKNIQSLEDSVSQVQTNMSFLADENYMAQVGRTNVEREIKNLKEEAGVQARKLADASSSIKSYEEAIRKADMGDLTPSSTRKPAISTSEASIYGSATKLRAPVTPRKENNSRPDSNKTARDSIVKRRSQLESFNKSLSSASCASEAKKTSSPILDNIRNLRIVKSFGKSTKDSTTKQAPTREHLHGVATCDIKNPHQEYISCAESLSAGIKKSLSAVFSSFSFQRKENGAKHKEKFKNKLNTKGTEKDQIQTKSKPHSSKLERTLPPRQDSTSSRPCSESSGKTLIKVCRRKEQINSNTRHYQRRIFRRRQEFLI